MLTFTTLSGSEKHDTEIIHNLVYDLLLRSGQNRLPISPYAILTSNWNIVFESYESMSDFSISNYDVLLKTYKEYGAVYYNPDENQYGLMVNEKGSINDIVFGLALTIAYIELNFITPEELVLISDKNSTAFEFALCLLAPDILLLATSCIDNISIMNVTHLPFRYSILAEKRLKKEAFKKFFLKNTKVEELFLEQCKKYILEYYKKRKKLQ